MNHQYWLLTLLCFITGNIIAQNRNGSDYGAIKGIVQDSVHNYKVRLASVAIYNDQSSELINYTLTNQFGEFTLSQLPLNTKLNLLVTMQGYTTKKVILSVSNKKEQYDCGIVMIIPEKQHGLNVLDEVVVKSVAPVRMNGDTLEFNANAFKLDTNAVVEDLVRKLPGFVLWGDGLITVNGKKVERVLVGGKPFFGENAKTALQNLPKESVEKIQVYNVDNEKKNSQDSLTEVNIKLKKDKGRGLFGKTALGLGTDRRYSADGMLNLFNSYTQLGLVGTSNNTNAIADNVNVLVQYNAFKGLAANIDYQPNFMLQGITTSKAVGAIFQHDFIPSPSFYNNNRIQADYLLRNSSNNYSKDIITEIATDPDNKITQTENSQSSIKSVINTLNSTYTKKTNLYELQIIPSWYRNDGININSATLDQRNSKGMLSSSTRINQNEYLNANTNLDLQFKTGVNGNKPWGGLFFGYQLSNKQVQNNQTIFYELVPLITGINRTKINRLNNSNSRELTNTVSFGSKQVKRMLFNNYYLGGVNIGVDNVASWNVLNGNSNVLDLDSTSKKYDLNSYLTNSNRYQTISYIPEIILSKNLNKRLMDRFEKSTNFSVSFQEQFFLQNSRSEKNFQNFTRNYAVFLPVLSITNVNHRFGRYLRQFNLDFKTKADYPTLEEIAPLVDSSSLYYMRKGNPDINFQRTTQLTIKLSHQAEKRNKDNISISASLTAGLIKRKIADSIDFNNVGRQTVSVANVDGYRFVNGTCSLMQPVKLSSSSSLQFNLSGNASFERSPNYVNRQLNITSIQSWNNKLDIFYLYKNIFTVNFHQEYSGYKSKQAIIGQDFFNKLTKSSLNTSLNLPNSFTISNNVTLNNNRSSVFTKQRFTIWNISLTKRLLKRNNLECKFSAFDLLRNNKGILAYGSNSSLTTGNVNVLRNYYMITVAYYPRKF